MGGLKPPQAPTCLHPWINSIWPGYMCYFLDSGKGTNVSLLNAVHKERSHTLLFELYSCLIFCSGQAHSVHDRKEAAVHSAVLQLHSYHCHFWSLHQMPIYNSQLLLHFVANGFQIGFSHATHTCTPAKKSHPSANKHPSVVQMV